jgi:hypothetical protein
LTNKVRNPKAKGSVQNNFLIFGRGYLMNNINYFKLKQESEATDASSLFEGAAITSRLAIAPPPAAS